MRVRHKQPTLVSMWMLDVFCCALGCVTLLWLMNTRQAGDQTAAAQSAINDLHATRSELATARTILDATRLKLNADLQQLTNQLAALRVEKDQLGRQLGIAEAEAKSVRELLDDRNLVLSSTQKKLEARITEISANAAKIEDAEEQLRKKQKDIDAHRKQLAEKVAARDELAALLRKKEEEQTATTKRAAELLAKIADLELRLRNVTASAQASVTQKDKDLAAATGQVKDLDKKLTDANATIIDLQGDKAKLADKIDKIRKETEAKFAGIAMTGLRVVFVVDKSGSMDRTDENTVAPTKWPTVAETVAKVMRSIPELEQFQVIVFSRDARWLFGEGEWQAFAGEKSAGRVRDALLKVKVEGDTNMYAAFDLAFSQRQRGMDTLYLFSDGLPTSGPGISDELLKRNPPLREPERSELLSRHIRSTLNSGWNRISPGRPKVKINSVGFFYESPEVGAFLWALSRENDGSFVGMSRP